MVARGWRVPEQNKTVGQPFILPFISEPRTRLISRNGSQGSRALLDGKGRGSASFSGTQSRGREGCGSGPEGAPGAWIPHPLFTRVCPQETEPQCLQVLRPCTSWAERILSQQYPA